MKKALVLLTRNEEESLVKIFDSIPRDCADEIFAVDGDSTDGTREFLESRGVRVMGQPRLGRGVAFRVAARATDAEAMVFFSPDGNEDPGDIPRLFGKIEEGYDVVIASRMMRGAFNEEDVSWFRPRKWVNQAFTLLANVLWKKSGPYVTDAINGFRAVKRSVFERTLCDAEGFVIEYQMTIRALKTGLRIAEIPTREGQRLGGESGAKSFPTGVVFVRTLLREMWLGGKFKKV